MTKLCEIFRTGTHTSSNGTVKNWTTDDLDLMVTNFNTKNPDVPIVIGHPKTNDPAYGWVDSLKRVGDSLFAGFKQVAPEFAQAVNAGHFKTRSISVAPDGSLRHIGWLGAMPPAIKGLSGFQFEEDENAENYDFSEFEDYKFQTTANIFERIRDFFIEKFGLETAETVISRFQLENLKQIEDKDDEAVREFCAALEPDNKEDLMQQKQQNDALMSKIAEFEEQLKDKDRIINDLRNEKAEIDKRSRKEKYLQFAQKAIEDGHILPAQKEIVTDFMEAAYNCDVQTNQDFSEDDENTLTNRFKTFVTGLKQVEFSELTQDKVNKDILDFNDPIAVSKAVSEYVTNAKKDGKNISESQALREIKNKTV